MFASLRITGLAMLASLSLTACYNDGGGYSRMSVGYGSVSPSYYGWHDNFYYPGNGYYVYDRGGKRHRWNTVQQRYWQDRRRSFRGIDRDDRRELRSNWRDYRRDRRGDDRGFRQERREDSRGVRRGEVTREQFRGDRRGDRRLHRQELRRDRGEWRRENRRDRRD